MKYREHRGGLSESMETVREIASTREAIALEAGLMLGRLVTPDEVRVSPYGYDARIMWDTHIVEIDGFGPIGFTDGPLPNV